MSKQNNKTPKSEIKIVKEKTPSLLATLVQNTGRALTEQELRQIHKMLAISVLIDREAPSVVSHDQLIVRGVDLLEKDRQDREKLDELVTKIGTAVEVALNKKGSKFDKSSPEAFKATLASWQHAKKTANSFKKMFGITPAKADSLTDEEICSQIFLHFRA